MFLFKKKKAEPEPVKIDPRDSRYWRDDDEIFNYEYDESRILYVNSFENGLDGWQPREPDAGHYDFGKYNVTVELTDEESRSGTKCMKITDRRYNWNGAFLDITSMIRAQVADYEVMVWVKLRPEAKSCRIRIMLETYEQIGNAQFPAFIEVEDYADYRGILSKFRLPVGSDSRSGNNSPSRNMYTRRRFLQALEPFSPEPNWLCKHCLQLPPGSPMPVIPSNEPQSGGLEPPVYFE